MTHFDSYIKGVMDFTDMLYLQRLSLSGYCHAADSQCTVSRLGDKSAMK